MPYSEKPWLDPTTNQLAAWDQIATRTVQPVQNIDKDGNVINGGAAGSPTDPVYTNEVQGTGATVSVVAASATEVTLAPSNANRVSVEIVNNSTETMYVKKGAGATTSSWSEKLFQDDVYIIDDFSGDVTAAWGAATGNANVTITVL